MQDVRFVLSESAEIVAGGALVVAGVLKARQISTFEGSLPALPVFGKLFVTRWTASAAARTIVGLEIALGAMFVAGYFHTLTGLAVMMVYLSFLLLWYSASLPRANVPSIAGASAQRAG